MRNPMFPDPVPTIAASTNTLQLHPVSDTILSAFEMWYQTQYLADLENELRSLQTRINWIRAQLGKYPKCSKCGCEVK